ncbi:MAG: M20/M25/M40 family metallo-hydrolase [Oscillospiraceae bacterium]|jgi:tripeptide aminopeptidase|nr:M20/M25/M40 family metallo-hydrolase [Oscillospiraceae bacterium]
MNTQRLIDTFCGLVSLDSPSFGERAVADFLIAELSALGFAVREFPIEGGDSGNVYGFLEGRGDGAGLPPVLLCAHMDTVEPSRGKRAVIREDGVITSGGDTVLGADDFAGIAAILEALRSLENHRPVEVLFCPAEEVYGKGSAQFDISLIKSAECYVLDLGGTVGTAAYTAPTIISWEAAVHGKAAHAGFAPQDGVHAIQLAAAVIAALPLGKIDNETTCNAGLISGGTATNIIPDYCLVKGEIRSFSHAKALKRVKIVKEAFEEIGKVDFNYTVNIRAYITPPDAPVVLRFKEACERAGLEANFVKTFGGSDYNHFAQKGLSGLVIACAMSDVHSCGEFTTIAELENIAKLTMELIK